MEDLLANSVPWSPEGTQDSIAALLQGLREGATMECTVCPCSSGGDKGKQFRVQDGRLQRRSSASACWWDVIAGPWDDYDGWRQGWSTHEFHRVSP
jgi:hypothetical protein